MNLLSICHVSKEIGMGHFMRQVNIAAELELRGHNITFVVSDYSPAIELLDKKKIPYSKSDKTPFELPPELKIDVAILDINDTEVDRVKTIKTNCAKVVSIDDQGSGRDLVDLLIDSNLSSSDSTETKQLFGPKYVVMDNRFSQFCKRQKKINSKIEKVVISMGGTDPQNIGVAATKFLIKSRLDISIDLILGAGTQESDCKQGDIEFIKKNRRCKIYQNLPHLAEKLFSADILICAGGITLYEACAIGAPALVINQVESQQNKALLVQKWGAAVNFGVWEESILDKLIQTINTMDCEQRKKMSDAGKDMIDGKGLQRVIDEIEKL